MAEIRIPNYIIDERFITAIKHDRISYVISAIETRPQWLTTFFMSVHDGDCGLLDQQLYKPVKLFLHPAAYAILFDSPRCLYYFIKKRYDTRTTGVVVDCPMKSKDVRWSKDIYRLQTVHPFTLTFLDTRVFGQLAFSPFDINGEFWIQYRLVSSKINRVHTMKSRGVWEFAWMFYKDFRHQQNILKATELLIFQGLDATEAFQRLNFTALLKIQFKLRHGKFNTLDDFENAVSFLGILLHNNCNFEKIRSMQSVYVYFKLFLKEHKRIDTENRLGSRLQKMALSFFGVSNRFRQDALSNKESAVYRHWLCIGDPYRLQYQCIRLIRRLVGSLLFKPKISQLTKDHRLFQLITQELSIIKDDSSETSETSLFSGGKPSTFKKSVKIKV